MWSARREMWRAYIEADGGKIDIGFHQSDEEARVVRDMVSLKIRGATFILRRAGDQLRPMQL